MQYLINANFASYFAGAFLKTTLIYLYHHWCILLSSIRIYLIIESVDSISKDERGFPLTQYITNGRISRAG